MTAVDRESIKEFSMSAIERVFALQRTHKWSVKNSTAAERKSKLERLKNAVIANADAIRRALHADLRKPDAEAAGEISSVENDINDAVEHIESWMAPVEITPAPMFVGARARIVYEARGVCLVFGPWNFPFQLLFEPLVPVIAAGNTAILKPNELAPATSRVSAEIIRQVFDEREVAVFEGGIEVAEQLLALPVDHVFFTGSPKVGRVVMGAAARHLSSVTLELGGKCPVILDDTTDLAAAAATIAAARCYNSGQVCLCPDIAWVPAAKREALVAHLKDAVGSMLYQNGKLNKSAFGRMVDRRNYDRVKGYLDDAVERGAKVAFGGTTEADEPPEARIMREEIFGPILPIQVYHTPADVCAAVQGGGKPLAMYIYSNDAEFVDTVLRNTSSGGVTVNGWAMHWFEPQLPFGGVNESGIGRYHGLHGFREVSHERSVFLQP
jgi:aldehyde dehydrogenase (NAD+)